MTQNDTSLILVKHPLIKNHTA